MGRIRTAAYFVMGPADSWHPPIPYTSSDHIHTTRRLHASPLTYLPTICCQHAIRPIQPSQRAPNGQPHRRDGPSRKVGGRGCISTHVPQHATSCQLLACSLTCIRMDLTCLHVPKILPPVVPRSRRPSRLVSSRHPRPLVSWRRRWSATR